MSTESVKPVLVSASRSDLEAWCAGRGFPRFRADQIYKHIRERLAITPDEMNNIPKDLKAALKEDFFCPSSSIDAVDGSPDEVEKLRLCLYDGEMIEVAVIPMGEKRTLCLSTQVGCPVQCRFCASGVGGLVRNLKCGEIIEEFLWGCSRIGAKCDNIVFMGIGEGLLNTKELFPALDILTSGFGMSPRRITVSTSGYLPGMEAFANLRREYNLAVSLHAPDDVTRAKLIPDPLRYSVSDIINAADNYYKSSGRQYTLEYTLISGINDSISHAAALGELARRHHAKINLIPYNDTASQFKRPALRDIEAFERAVADTGARVTRRVEKGKRASAACGQLRAAKVKAGE
ncbi:MAG: 23S rRNA (adenine(2503)-C(2))-methyltransferase RlmN [Lentisphaeria bacterium]|nr:23S rRNA (adenine(2503)-C(2))-methyltransferase RlmN [Lentisphaeria bacterium]